MWEQKQKLILAGAALGSFLSGAAASYFILNKRLESQYEARVAAEVEEAKEFYSRLHKTGKYATPESAAEALNEEEVDLMADAVEAIQSYSVDAEEAVKVVREVTEVNIFTQQDIQSLWDQEREERLRDALSPYVISKEEFFQNEPDHVQLSFTYYEGDQALADEQEQHVPDYSIVGEDNLVKFGYGSDDPNVVYVRNEQKNIDVEISRSNGKYAYEVLGLEHSDYGTKRKGVKKFRADLE